MKKLSGTLRNAIIAASVACIAPNNMHADETGHWTVKPITERMRAAPWWVALSNPVAPEEPLGWRFSEMTSFVVFACTEEQREILISFEPKRPKLPRARANLADGALAEMVKLFGLDRLIKVRTRWDDTTTDMTLVRVPDESYLRFFDDEEAARLLKGARTFLVELPWENGDVSYFRHSLTGSRAAIERAERECNAQQRAAKAREQQQRQEDAKTAAGTPTAKPEQREQTGTVEPMPVVESRTPQPARNTAETAIAVLPDDDQAWIRSSCPRHIGPASWTRCVRREVRAIRAGMPDISTLDGEDQAWIHSSCPRHIGPASWARCVQREVQAIRAGMPDTSTLDTDEQTWVHSSCPRHIGPASWARCVEREVQAIQAGMPDISALDADDQAWIRSSCPRHIGPASWARCVEREAQTLRAAQ